MNYNKMCPAGKAIKIYDRIMSFNVKRSYFTKFTYLLAALKDQNTLTIEVVQPTETSALIEKPGEFGITLSYEKDSLGLLVKDIDEAATTTTTTLTTLTTTTATTTKGC
ncbi:unnamed protein product [Polarella glacialis]|uniref:Uncharacterized protein n=1 Tax=Polarella glacialis TaxID=89957 RepID=A0A813GGF4_POLGL|nr:unnamed protein product [Polarella glacialis]